MRRLAYALAAGLLSSTPVFATIINVTTTTDKFGSGTGCSLREAMYAANHNVAVSDCPAGTGSDTGGTGADTIIVPSGTYTLTIPGSGEDQGMTGDLDYRWSGDALTIQGAGSASTVIDGNGLDRVFDIDAGFPVTISGMTIRNGSITGEDGGGIRASGGQLTLDDCVILNNTARNGGGLNISASVTVSYCTISGNVANGAGVLGNIAGGGINLSSGSLHIVNSTVSGNAASDGAGIFGYAVTIDRSTITGNHAAHNGGGLNGTGTSVVVNSTVSGNTAGNGAGIWGTATIDKSTISGNQASGSGGGLWCPAGTPVVVNSTISGNSAGAAASTGVYTSAPLTVSNATIVDAFQNDHLPRSPGFEQTNVRNSILAAGYSGINPLDEGHNLFGGNPMLGPLQDNGGPTYTHALLPGSPAIDAGSMCEATDQRGGLRPYGPACDIGAFEAGATPATTTTTTSTTTSTTDTSTTTTTTSTTSTSASSTTSSPPTVTTTSTTTTTTATTPQPCAGLPCDDGDPCTVDACAANQCVHQEVTGREEVTCAFERPLDCGGTPIPSGVATLWDRAHALTTAAMQSSPPKAKRLLKRSGSLLAKATRRLGQLALRRRDPMPSACAAALQAVLENAAGRLATCLASRCFAHYDDHLAPDSDNDPAADPNDNASAPTVLHGRRLPGWEPLQRAGGVRSRNLRPR